MLKGPWSHCEMILSFECNIGLYCCTRWVHAVYFLVCGVRRVRCEGGGPETLDGKENRLLGHFVGNVYSDNPESYTESVGCYQQVNKSICQKTYRYRRSRRHLEKRASWGNQNSLRLKLSGSQVPQGFHESHANVHVFPVASFLSLTVATNTFCCFAPVSLSEKSMGRLSSCA